jgi:hypothetical protein
MYWTDFAPKRPDLILLHKGHGCLEKYFIIPFRTGMLCYILGLKHTVDLNTKLKESEDFGWIRIRKRSSDSNPDPVLK